MARFDDEAPGGNALPWFLFGVGLGAALGLLFAPQSGAETRRVLGKKVRKLKHLAEDRFEAVMDNAGQKAREIRETLTEGAEDDDDEEFSPRPSRAREELERRLAAARSRRRPPAAAPAAVEEDEEPGA